ncbi:acyl-CoA thioesterase [Planococcus salinarum]|uniref:acyl-CoA thioesterase n=1 Tax=Planococcus salinarum TaxID=622695 RepID=UPI000E3C69DC|nr:acyl-CoA thioesterase [Planococcus salinarum]TAA72004.1 acyl-CoA thioesterase [Planococcus salinarum]
MAYETKVKVRFCETDALGHISNISYFIYLEEARTDFFIDLGFGADLEDWKVILASAKCDFVRQGYYNQKLEVVTEVLRIGRSSFTIVHRIQDAETGELIANGEASAVYFDFKAQKSEKIPDNLRKMLEKHLVKESVANDQ